MSFVAHGHLVSVRENILTGPFLFNFKRNQRNKHFDTNFVKIHSAVMEIQVLSFSCFVLF